MFDKPTREKIARITIHVLHPR